MRPPLARWSRRGQGTVVRAASSGQDGLMPNPLNPARFELVTFDCYGTLVDWETGILSAMLPVLERHGVHASAGEILQAYARSESAAEAGEYVSYAEVLRLTFTGMARDLGFAPRSAEVGTLVKALPTWVPFGDTVAALRRLAGRYRLGIISNVDDEMLETTLAMLGVDFDVVVTAESVGAYKPDPRMFEAALDRAAEIVGGDRSKWLHAGCSLHHDMAPARAMGIPCVHVLRDSGREGCTPEVEGLVTPDAVVPDMAGLWRWISSGAA